MYSELSVIFFSLCFTYADNRGVAKTVTLRDGNQMPGFGIGTWLGFDKSRIPVVPVGDEVQKAVEWAIDAGYRHIDTAYIYFTEDQVGRAINNKIAEGVIKREDVYVTTKLWSTFHAKDDVVPALKLSLENLKMDYVDLYLIHWPIALHKNESIDPTIDYVETWEGMIEAQRQGLTKSIGVSNFNIKQLDRLISLSNVTPAALQVEINLNLQQPALLSYCRSENITVTGYTPFGSLFPQKAKADAPPPRVDEPALVELARKYNKTVPQIVLRYLVELGVVPIPKSLTKARVEQNIQIFDFELTQAERDLLRSYDRNHRVDVIKEWASSPHYPFEE